MIAGYLGAGKTTLINELLAHDHRQRLAVLVNDFGAVNIDAALIAEHNGQTISLKNGCICCSIADELGDALDRVLALEPPPDQIVIEASGVADPANVAAYGQGWPGCRLDAVIVFADAETVRARSRDQFVGELVTRQLRRADIVMVTKYDLVTEAELAAVVDWLAGQVPRAPTLTPSCRPARPSAAPGGQSSLGGNVAAAAPQRRLRHGRSSLRVGCRRGRRRPRSRPSRRRAAGLARVCPTRQGRPPVQRPPRQAPRHPQSRAALEHRGSPQRPRLKPQQQARCDRPARNPPPPRPHRITAQPTPRILTRSLLRSYNDRNGLLSQLPATRRSWALPVGAIPCKCRAGKT